MQKPTIGRIVHVLWREKVCPALVTRVFDDGRVNLRALPDESNETPALVSVPLHEDEATARAIHAVHRSTSAGTAPHAFWPSHG
jgi:hypothetical protein